MDMKHPYTVIPLLPEFPDHGFGIGGLVVPVDGIIYDGAGNAVFESGNAGSRDIEVYIIESYAGRVVQVENGACPIRGGHVAFIAEAAAQAAKREQNE